MVTQSLLPEELRVAHLVCQDEHIVTKQIRNKWHSNECH